MSKTAKKTAPKKEAAPKTAETEARIPVRVEVSGEYHTGTTTFTFAKGKRVSLPKSNAERHAKDGKVTLL